MEVTPTVHGSVARFTFDKDSTNKNIIFDSTRADGTLKFNNDGTFEASSNHTGNGMQTMYVYGKFSEKPSNTSVQNTKQGIASFNSEVVETILVAVAQHTSFAFHMKFNVIFAMRIANRQTCTIANKGRDKPFKIFSI